MLAHLQQRFDQIELNRARLFTALRSCSSAQLHSRPKPEAWSINEIIHHVALAESFAVAYLEKKLDKISTVKKASWRAVWRTFLLKWVLRSPLKFKAPSPLVLPASGLELSELDTQWQSHRQKLQTLLARVTPEMLSLALYRHPVTGLMTVAQMLTFIEEHFAHHAAQIDRLRKETVEPSNATFMSR